MSDLIKRLEAATEGSFELGAEIICAVKGYRLLSVEPRATMNSPFHMAICAEAGLNDRFEFYADDPTQSLDAALTLRDRDNFPVLVIQEMGALGCLARIAVIDTTDGEMDPICHDGEAKTIPLALCIAALKARSASHE
jgi:hypothetical protein